MLVAPQTAGLAATGVLQSMLDSIEEKRAEAEKKATGKTDDAVLKARMKSDDALRAANDKINAFFFGALKNDDNPMAALIARFTDALGVSQGDGESTADFATRMQDVLTLTDLVTKDDADGNPMLVTLRTLRVSDTDLKNLMLGTTADDVAPSALTKLAARLATAAGVDPHDENLTLTMETVLTDARAKMPASLADIEKRSGLTELDITAAEMVEAIRSPWGDAAQKIKAALDDQAAGNKTMNTDMRKVLQRLEDVADPKTLEELKAERVQKDRTEVDDIETRQEREDDIDARETAKKLEEVQDVREVVKDHNDQVVKDGAPAAGSPEAVVAASQLLQVLVASVEATKTGEGGGSATARDPGAEPNMSDAEIDDALELTDDGQVLLAADLEPDADENSLPAAASDDVLTVRIDTIGIYKLLAKDKGA